MIEGTGIGGAGLGAVATVVVAKGLAWLLAAQGAPGVGGGVGVGGASRARGASRVGAASGAGATDEAGAVAAAPEAGASAEAGAAEETAPNRNCLDGLRERHVEFVEWPTKGVRTPVKILGPLGVVRLRSHDPRSTSKTLLMDCELARALVDAAPAFHALGVRELLYSGAYQYRTRRRSTKLSEHAHGFAIDVHAFVIDPGDRRAVSAGAGEVGEAGAGASVEDPNAGIVVEVTRDFEPNVGKWAVTEQQDDCIGHPRTDVGRTLRTLACRLRASSIFREVITPDDNPDHHDHFHLEAFPDPLTRTRAVLARKPSVTDD